MKSLFHKLFKLHLRSSNKPLEDYLTEIFAYCLEHNSSLLQAFLQTFKIHESPYNSSRVTTQHTLKALEGHDTDSRPDIAVFLDNKTIFIENKVGSGEGKSQLSRYAEHLNVISGQKALVYITRYYDPKHSSTILAKCETGEIEFIQIRWLQVYHFLLPHTTLPVVKELIDFMTEIGLTMSNQFTDNDIVALKHFSKVRKMMSEAISGEVKKKFEKLAGGSSSSLAVLNQLKRKDRYLVKEDQHKSMWIGYGFWLNAYSEKPYPEVRFMIEVGPKSKKRAEIISTFKQIAEKDKEWYGYGLNDPTVWSSTSLSCSLEKFMQQEDQIQAIQDYFKYCFQKVDALKAKLPDLPWKVISSK